jgi:hypothetical protein
MAHVEDVLLWAIAQKGEAYVFGAEVPLTAQDGDQWDCSELVQWSCGKAGVAPAVPDGAFNQWSQIKQANGLISVRDGINTRGALLFAGDGTGSGRDAIFHVAFSLGDGTTIEARGKKWGVGCWASVGRFDFAGRIGGVDYSKGVQPLTPPPPAAVPAFPGVTKLGASGDAVRQLQQRLRDRGWNVSVDGTFGRPPRSSCARSSRTSTWRMTVWSARRPGKPSGGPRSPDGASREGSVDQGLIRCR